MNKKELFESKPILKSLFILGLPLVLSQLINVLYNIVDRIFIGNLPSIGGDALAGVGITFPIIVIITAFASLVGVGGAPLAAIRLGEKKPNEARNVMMNSFVMLMGVGIILTIITLIFGPQILTLFGMTEELMKYGLDYLNIYAIGTVFVMVNVGLSAYISTQGYTKEAAITVLVGALLNILLDWLLMLVFKFGVKGAAIATIVSQGVSALLIVLFLRSKKSNLKLSFKDFKFEYKTSLKILSLGISPFVMQTTEALIQIVFNTQIVKYGGADYIIYLNIMTVMLSLLQFIVLPVNGLAQGASPLISYNFGSGNFKRVKEAYKALNIISVIYTIIFYLVILAIPGSIFKIFNQDPQALAVAPRIMRIFFMGMSIFGIQMATQTTFMALGESVTSLIMALLRKVIILIPLAYILPLFMGLDGVFFAEMIADFAAATITFTTFQLMISKIFKKRQDKINQDNLDIEKAA